MHNSKDSAGKYRLKLSGNDCCGKSVWRWEKHLYKKKRKFLVFQSLDWLWNSLWWCRRSVLTWIRGNGKFLYHALSLKIQTLRLRPLLQMLGTRSIWDFGQFELSGFTDTNTPKVNNSEKKSLADQLWVLEREIEDNYLSPWYRKKWIPFVLFLRKSRLCPPVRQEQRTRGSESLYTSHFRIWAAGKTVDIGHCWLVWFMSGLWILLNAGIQIKHRTVWPCDWLRGFVVTNAPIYGFLSEKIITIVTGCLIWVDGREGDKNLPVCHHNQVFFVLFSSAENVEEDSYSDSPYTRPFFCPPPGGGGKTGFYSQLV